MEHLIKAKDFVHASDNERVEFMQALDKLSSDEVAHSEEQLRSATKAVAQQVGQNNFPFDLADGVFMANHAVKTIKYLAGSKEESLWPDLLQILVACYEGGPSTGQLCVAEELLNNTGVKKYIQSLRGENLGELLKIFRRDFSPQHTDLAPTVEDHVVDRYYSTVTYFNGHIIGILCGGKLGEPPALVDVQTANQPIADLLEFCMEQMNSQPQKKTASIYNNMQEHLRRMFQRRAKTNAMFLKITRMIPGYLKTFEKIVSDGKYPRHEFCHGSMKSWLSYMMVPLEEGKEEAKEYLQDAVSLLFILATHSNSNVRPLAVEVCDRLRGLKKSLSKGMNLSLNKLELLYPMDTSLADELIGKYTKAIVWPALKHGEEQQAILQTFTCLLNATYNHNLVALITRGLKECKQKQFWKENTDSIAGLLEALIIAAKKLPKDDNKDKDGSNSDDDSDDSTDDDSDDDNSNDRNQGDKEELKKRKALKENTMDQYRALKDLLELIVDNLEKANSVTPKINTMAAKAIVEAVQLRQSNFSDIIYHFEQVQWQDAEEDYKALLSAITECVKDDVFECGNQTLVGLVIANIYNGMKCVSSAGQSLIPFVPHFIQLSEQLMSKDMCSSDDDLTVHGQLLLAVFVFMTYHTNDITGLSDLLGLPFLYMSGHGSTLQGVSAQILGLMAQHPTTVLPHTQRVVDAVCKDPCNMQLILLLKAIFPHNKPPVLARLSDLVKSVESGDVGGKVMWLQLLYTMASEEPQAFTEAEVETMMDYASKPSLSPHVFRIFEELGRRNPTVMRQQQDSMICICKKRSEVITQAMQIVGYLLTDDIDETADTLQQILRLLKTVNAGNKLPIMTCLHQIGLQDRTLLEPHRGIVQETMSEPDCKEVCQQLLDIIDGRTAKDLGIEVADQKATLKQVKGQVEDTGKTVTTMNKTLVKHGEDINQAKDDIKTAEGKIEKLEEEMDDVEEKVEEIDHKTMTNAPAWSRDVSLLLNPEAAADWRLLAQRLGYSNKDIRAWATQADPCMAVLSEWYATHKGSEATHAVLKALEEINRMDTADVVKKALQEADGVVTDAPEDTGPLPPVFLSYQWGHQPQARLLRQHLEAAGFPCWMDLGQMGGGDKLYAKIDAGMRAATVVVCCVTSKYAQSDNCNREVNLAVTVGKPIIPLLMDKMSWPPEGAMGPIFGEYLFIRFFARPGEKKNEDVYWPEAKFQELLGQLRYNIVPDESIIKPEYKEWWVPKEEKIVIPTSKQQESKPQTSTQAGSSGDETISASPAVFLSYQWGKQAQIRNLYTRLTALGLTCWMDIHQMGGGDSLYDKIDRGVRGCKVVVSCVTQKYSLSANCRREVSLADAIKKPIIPILLESMSWPPEGPMSMVFTQLLYIGFHKDLAAQDTWQGPKFDELLSKIRQYVPLDLMDVPSSTDGRVDKGDDKGRIGSGEALPKSIVKPRAHVRAKKVGVKDNSENKAVSSSSSPAKEVESEERRPFDAKKEWRKVQNVGKVVTYSRSCIIL